MYFVSLCWSSHSIHPLFSWVWWASLWPLLWTLYQENYHRFIKGFFEVCLCLHLDTFLCLLVLLDSLCLFLCIRWKTYLSHWRSGLEQNRTWPIGPRSTIPPGHQSQALLGHCLCMLWVPASYGSKSISLPLPPILMWPFYLLLWRCCSSSFQDFFRENYLICSYRTVTAVGEVSSGSSFPDILNSLLSLKPIF